VKLSVFFGSFTFLLLKQENTLSDGNYESTIVRGGRHSESAFHHMYDSLSGLAPHS